MNDSRPYDPDPLYVSPDTDDEPWAVPVEERPRSFWLAWVRGLLLILAPHGRGCLCPRHRR